MTRRHVFVAGLVASVVLLAALASTQVTAIHDAWRRMDDPTYEGPPRIDAVVADGATEQDVFETIGTLSDVAPSGIERVDLDLERRRVTIELREYHRGDDVPAATAMHRARNELLARLRRDGSVIRVTRINWNPAP